jgi:choline kinase
MPTTAETPKCLAEVKGRRILDWIVDAFTANGVIRINFIGGYRIEKVQAAFPQFRFHHNAQWERNNILASLMCAEPEMDEPFISCYSDTLFTPQVIQRLLASQSDISLVVDTDWKSRYASRTQHPPDDAEKVTASNGFITRIHRDIEESAAFGEFTGMTKFSAAGAAALRAHYHRCRNLYDGMPFREAASFDKAYLIHLFQEMIEHGIQMTPVATPGGYMEIDTQEDFEIARRSWETAP